VRVSGRRSWYDLGLRELYDYRQLVRVLAARDFKLRYRQTALGAAGVVLGPLLTAAVTTFVFGQIAGLRSEGVPYFAFSYAGLLGWNIFAGLIGRSAGILIGNPGLITKIYVPRLALPFSGVFVAMIDLAIGSLFMILVMAVTTLWPGLPILLLPVWILALMGFGLGIGSAFGAGMVHFRDVGLATGLALQTLMYLTPVAYAASEAPHRFSFLYTLNPMAALIDGFRWSLLGTPAPSATRAIVSVALSVVALVAGCSIFARLERGFADVI
jgi:lipopolysaccharide transport system permease protein